MTQHKEATCGHGARSQGRRQDRGFTLLEVLAALAIAVPALTLLYRQGAVSTGTTASSILVSEAISRAQSRLDMVTADSLAPGEQDGDDGGGFRWRTRIMLVASTTPSRLSPRALPYAGGTALFAIAVEISWPGMAGMRSLTLNTRRLGPALAIRP